MLVCALGAPLRVAETNYTEGKTLVLRLNEKARQLYEEGKALKVHYHCIHLSKGWHNQYLFCFLQVETPSEVAAVSDPPLMIRSEDKCDPDSLKTNPETCLSRVVLALKNYSRIFGESGIFQGQNTKCDKWRANATAIAVVTEQILEALKEPSETPTPMMMANWMTEGYLCRDSVERLYSFSIMTARVFSHLSSLQQND
ncbi:interleukin-23 subunit alpha-like [Ictalurus furcatus]|uniref:interleukin-23 subunit alpha-like n=1 Tax=Ictalurus furcatus TaxID=66913 RepID=UPI0023500E25|nr:interleukin-23 subunit alpha-like [Ictalurus furcatus]